MKFSLNEGGVRNIGAIWSPRLAHKNYVNKEPMHIVDWLPTFFAAAQGNVDILKGIDGKNLWPMFTNPFSRPPKRDPIVLNMDEIQKYEAILSEDGKFKFINGKFFFFISNQISWITFETT